MISVHSSGITQVWNLMAGEKLHEIPAARFFAWSPDSKRLATSSTGAVQLWNTETWELIITLNPERGFNEYSVWGLYWHPDNTWLLVYHLSFNSLEIWDMTNYQRINSQDHTIAGNPSWSPDGSQFAIPAYRTVVFDRSYFLSDSSRDYTVIGDFESYSTAWSPDSKLLAVGDTYGDSTKGTITIYDVKQQSVIQHLKPFPFSGPVDMKWNPDGKRLAVAGRKEDDFVIQIWDWEAKRLLDTYSLGEEIFLFEGFSWTKYGGRVIYGASAATNVRNVDNLNDPRTGIYVQTPTSTLETVQTIAASCENQLLTQEGLDHLTLTSLPSFIKEIKALPEGAIPEACAADLIAVAEAVIAAP
jgi:WD40 repeat protein